MIEFSSTLSGPFSVRVEERSMGLYYWVLSQLSDKPQAGDLRIDASDHPYPTHEAALRAGAACLRAFKSGLPATAVPQ